MKHLFLTIILIITFSACGSEYQQDEETQKQHYKDTVVHTTDVKAFDQKIKRFVDMAKKTYPQAKQQYLKGLPKDHTFFVTVRLFDGPNLMEQVFLKVHKISGGEIFGTIANQILRITNYKQGDMAVVKEDEIVDWTIVDDQGKEIGNYVGKYIDALKGKYIGVILKVTIQANGIVTKAQFVSAITHRKQDVSYILTNTEKREAERRAMKIVFKKSAKTRNAFTYIFYNVQKEIFENPKKRNA